MSLHPAKLRAFSSRLPLVLVALFAASGCDSAVEQDRFADAASGRSEGFTQTSGTGEIVQEDPDDWRQAPLFAGQFYISDPAFPNPATFGVDGVINLTVQVQFDDVFRGGLRVSARPPADARCYEERLNCLISSIAVRPEAQRAGGYTFQLPVATLAREGRGLVRVYLLTADGEVVSYGDVLIQ